MKAEAFSVRGPLAAILSFCSSLLLWKNLRSRYTTSQTTASTPMPSPAVTSHKCWVPLPAWSMAHISPVARFLFSTSCSQDVPPKGSPPNCPYGRPFRAEQRTKINDRQCADSKECPQRQLVLGGDGPPQ